MGTTIAEKIQIIKNNRDAIWQAIVDKGGNITGNFLTYADAISGISGGGNSSTKRSDVNFYDYDGTRLYSYTMADFLSLSSMPKLPSRDGLICQGWNYDIDIAKEYVEEYGKLDIGATYITDDGKTRLYIDIVADGRMNIPLNVFLIPEGFTPEGNPEDYNDTIVSNGRLIIDWGDGNIEEIVNCGYYKLRHKYQEIGNYVISIATNEGYELILGGGEVGEWTGIMYDQDDYTTNEFYSSMLKYVEIGNNVPRISSYAFYKCYSLASVVIPNSITSVGERSFNQCSSLASVVIPNGVTTIGPSVFGNCALKSVVIPNSVTSIDSNAFYSCTYMPSVVIPNAVTSMGYNAFGNTQLKYYDFSHYTSIPNMTTSSIFGYANDNWYILVPSHLYDTWINESNWSMWADRIITDKSIIDNDD